MKSLLTVLLALPLFLSSPASAQQELVEHIIDVDNVGNPMPIALPKAVGDAAGVEMLAVIERDLSLTGYFDLIDRAAYLEKDKGPAPGDFEFGPWRTINTVVLAKTRVTRDGDKLTADVYVYDVGTGDKLAGKRFSGSVDQTRYLGHKIADAIVFAVTGESGFFGSRVLAIGTRTGNKEVYVMDIDGRGVIPITRNGSINLSPTWSPNQNEVAWTSFKRGNPDAYIKDLKSGRTRVLSNKPGLNSGAAYSPTGSQVAITRTANGDADIYVLDPSNGQQLKRITKGGGIDVAPAFNPAGTQLAFASERSGGSQIYVQDIASGNASRVTMQGSWNGDPVWSPDGSKIVFVGRDKNFDIFVVDVASKKMHRITQNQGDNEDPSFSPDGRYIVFSSTRNGTSEIWMSDALSGKHQVKISQKGNWYQPVWSP